MTIKHILVDETQLITSEEEKYLLQIGDCLLESRKGNYTVSVKGMLCLVIPKVNNNYSSYIYPIVGTSGVFLQYYVQGKDHTLALWTAEGLMGILISLGHKPSSRISPRQISSHLFNCTRKMEGFGLPKKFGVVFGKIAKWIEYTDTFETANNYIIQKGQEPDELSSKTARLENLLRVRSQPQGENWSYGNAREGEVRLTQASVAHIELEDYDEDEDFDDD